MVLIHSIYLKRSGVKVLRRKLQYQSISKVSGISDNSSSHLHLCLVVFPKALSWSPAYLSCTLGTNNRKYCREVRGIIQVLSGHPLKAAPLHLGCSFYFYMALTFHVFLLSVL